MNVFLFANLGVEFRTPAAFLLFGVLAAAFIVGRRRAPSVAFPALVLFAADDGDSAGSPPQAAGAPLPASFRASLLFLPTFLKYVAAAFLIIAAARPVSKERLPDRPAGIDAVLVIDVSSSMRATDLDPARDRLLVAKAAALRFVAGRPTDRIGLVSFARFPDLRCPMTLDHRALAASLRSLPLVEADGPEDATGIGAAVMLAASSLAESASKSKAVLLLTDGEENVASAEAPGEIAPIHAAQYAAEKKIRVYTIAAGIGNPAPNGGFSPIDTKEVRRLAEKTSGRFFEARDARTVDAVFSEIDRLEKSEFDEPRWAITDRAFGLLVVGAALLLIAFLLDLTFLEVLA